MKGYLFAELGVTDNELFYNEYVVKVRPILKAYGVRMLSATDNPDVIEGGRNVKRVILLEFDSMERLKEFYYSDAYQEVAQIRFKSAKTHLYLLEGLR